MDRLWTPWRYTYITGKDAEPAKGVPRSLAAWLDSTDPEDITLRSRGCVFCNMIAAVDFAISHGMAPDLADQEALIVARSTHTFLCLNRYPYSTGHVMIVPYHHLDTLAGLPSETAAEIMTTAQRVDATLRAVYQPNGLNFGLNLGEAAGAGVANHLHMHALPRWSGDTNFMTVTAETRILPETLDTTWLKLRDAFSSEKP